MKSKLEGFIKTGCDGIEISTGDSPQRVEDMYGPMDYLNELIYSKDVGSFWQEVANTDDQELGRITEPSEVYVHVETNDLYNYIHFEYEGGTGFTLRMPVLVKDFNG
tara:strand:+ start:150 stop:470 length:321 start_codon:yes stop_codon:yes gene_type:complete